MGLVNKQTTTGYDPKRITRKNRTTVVAVEYNPEQETKKPTTKVEATVEGN